MSTHIEKQLTQIKGILETLEEATEHFSQLVKQKELHQSTSMLGMIVAGFEAIKGALHTSDETLNDHMEKLEKYILLMAQQLEQGSFMKISEILQFSFRPELRKFTESFEEVYGGTI